MAVERETYKLDEIFHTHVSYTPHGLLIEEYTGEEGACYISRGRQGKPIANVVAGRVLDYGEPLVNLWIHNTKAQPGRKLVLLSATSNAIRSLVMPQQVNPKSLQQGVVTVGTIAVALPSYSVPIGMELVIVADKENKAPVYVGPEGVTTATGMRLDPGAMSTMRVSDSSAVYAISSLADQKLLYSIGMTSEITGAGLNPTNIADGVVDVGTVAVQFPDQAIPGGISAVIRADEGNTDPIYIGGSTVTTATGHYLNAFDSINLSVDNLNKIYAIAGAAAQKARYIVEVY